MSNLLLQKGPPRAGSGSGEIKFFFQCPQRGRMGQQSFNSIGKTDPQLQSDLVWF